jgi:hypothetical protein
VVVEVGDETVAVGVGHVAVLHGLVERRLGGRPHRRLQARDVLAAPRGERLQRAPVALGGHQLRLGHAEVLRRGPVHRAQVDVDVVSGTRHAEAEAEAGARAAEDRAVARLDALLDLVRLLLGQAPVLHGGVDAGLRGVLDGVFERAPLHAEALRDVAQERVAVVAGLRRGHGGAASGGQRQAGGGERGRPAQGGLSHGSGLLVEWGMAALKRPDLRAR